MPVPTGRAPRWAAAALTALSLVLLCLATVTRSRAADLAALVALLGVATLLAARSRQPAPPPAVDEAVRRLARLEQLVAGSTGGMSLAELLPDMADRLRSSLDADFAAVLLVEPAGLTVRVASGSLAAGDVGTVVTLGNGMVGRVAQDGRSRTLADLGPERAAVPSLQLLNSGAAAALVAGGRTIGVVTVGSRRPGRHDASELSLLELAAERLAAAVEAARLGEAERRASLGAEHARGHLRLLGDASRILMQSVDEYEQPLVEIVENATGRFATFAAAYLATPDRQAGPGLRLLAARSTDEAGGGAVPAEALPALRAAMEAQQSRLVILEPPGEVEARDRPLAAALAARGLHAYVVAPIVVRGRPFGVLLFASGAGRRGYRPSDRGAADELAQRVALAVEAQLLYREATASAAVTAGHLERLRGLLTVWLAVAAAHDRAAILAEAAAGAARLLIPAQALVLVDDERYIGPAGTALPAVEDALLAVLDGAHGLISSEDLLTPVAAPVGPRWLAAPLRVADARRSWIVVGTDDGTFSPEDESLLVLLCQLAATMLTNASLDADSRAAAGRLTALFAASPAPIVALEADLTPWSWNPSAASLFALPADGARLPEQVATCVAELAREAAGAPGTRQRACTLDTDGGARSLLLMLAPISPTDATARGHILVVTDETERLALAAQFEQAQRLDAVGRLAGGVAHDFNNLLTVILGYADALLRRQPDGDPNRARVEAIHRAGTRGAELTRQLLTFSSHQGANPVVLHPAQVVDEVAGMLRQVLGEEVDLVRAPGGDELVTTIDRVQLEQVLLNVAINARDAMPAGGRLTVSVTRQRTGRGAEGGPVEWVAIAAADTGTGMDEQTLAHCLEPLFTTKGPGLGTGLGLSTAYGIAAHSGGDLRVASTLGVGTTVTLLLPPAVGAATERPAPALPTPWQPAEIGRGVVLLVDDDADVRTLVARTLRERGYRVVATASPAQALAALERWSGPVDLLLTDVAMPGMSGPELARAVQAVRPVPVLFMSGYAERLTAADPAGDLLAKPFTPDALIAAVSASLADRSRVGVRGQGSNR